MNPYKTLQVDRDAEQDVIEAAYKRLATKYHPDKDPSAAATKKMQGINAAYEILRDPERRGRYDREQQNRQAKQVEEEQRERQPERAPNFPVEEVSNRVFWKVAWAAAIIAVLVYLPWLAAAVAGIGVTIWVVRRYPRGVAKVLKWGIALAVGTAVYVWYQDYQREQRTKEELANLDIRELFDTQSRQFVDSCVVRASQDNPDLASPYCKCLGDALKASFDFSVIEVTSVYDYKNTFSARFTAAVPGSDTRNACADQVRPKPVPVPVPVPVVRQSPKRKPFVPALKDLDPEVQEALAPRAPKGATPP